jgi:hypothetical protein
LPWQDVSLFAQLVEQSWLAVESIEEYIEDFGMEAWKHGSMGACCIGTSTTNRVTPIVTLHPERFCDNDEQNEQHKNSCCGSAPSAYFSVVHEFRLLIQQCVVSIHIMGFIREAYGILDIV